MIPITIFYLLIILNLSSFWNLVEEEARPVCRHPSACPIGPCWRGRRAWTHSKPPEIRVEGAGWDGGEGG